MSRFFLKKSLHPTVHTPDALVVLDRHILPEGGPDIHTWKIRGPWVPSPLPYLSPEPACLWVCMDPFFIPHTHTHTHTTHPYYIPDQNTLLCTGHDTVVKQNLWGIFRLEWWQNSVLRSRNYLVPAPAHPTFVHNFGSGFGSRSSSSHILPLKTIF